LGEAGGQTAMLAEEETKAGVDTITKQLKNIQNEIAIKTAAFKQLYADIEGKPITMASIIGETARARAVEQADIGFLQAQALALQNNLSFAQQTAQKAVDTKYGPIEEELNIKAQQLELIQGQLSAKEKIRAEALKLFLNDQKTAIADAKATEKQRTDYAIKMLTAYPDSGIRIGADDYNTIQDKVQKSASYKAAIAKGDPRIDTDENVYSWLNDLINIPENKDATYEEIFSTFREQKGETLSDSELRNYLETKGFKPVEDVEDTKRTQTDSELKGLITSNFKEDEMTKEDIIIDINRGTETSQTDKDRALELVEELIPNELNNLLKKVKSEPDKYELRKDGIYRDRGFWTLSPQRWEKVYSF